MCLLIIRLSFLDKCLFRFQVFCLFFPPDLWSYLWHMDVPGVGVESELQLQAYTIAMATLDWSCICNLCHSLGKHQILNPLSEARDRIHIFTETILIGKGKYIAKVVNQPFIKLVGSLKDKSSKIIYVHDKWIKDTQNKIM